MSVLDPAVFDAAMAEIRERSKKSLYQRDFAAWQWDVLGERTYGKLAEIGDTALFGEKPRTLVKSANGSSKTYQGSRWAMWWVTAFPPEESLAILTAPTLRQVEIGTMAYMKERYGYVKRAALAAGRPMPWPGWIAETGEWKYATVGGNMTLAIARVPGASDAVSTFQGLRKTGGRNLILLDEAGGVSRDIYTAIEALMTSGESRMIGIGNPDRRGTPFYEAFNDPRQSAEYNLFTITAFDLPTLTGEVVYPDDPAKETLMLRGLTSAKWVAHKSRVWQTGGEIVFDEKTGLEWNHTGRPDGRYRSKVLGQFPDEDDHTFFPEETVLRARLRELPEEQCASAPIVLGVDLATMGTDESVVMMNQGGRCRVFAGKVTYDDGGETKETSGTWDKDDTIGAARRVHAIAKYLGATEVRVDAGGIGAGIATNLERLEEFAGKQYVVIRIDGSYRSADPARWANARAQNHDNLRELLAENALDLDYDDDALKDQLLSVTYDYNNRGAVAITPKKDMRSEMHGSPDRLDALIYACVDTRPLLNPPLGDMQKGDLAALDPMDVVAEDFQSFREMLL
jgi:hypothetical protein